MSFCAICTDDATDLERSEDGYLECKRCREEHPNFGGYSFESRPPTSDGCRATGSTQSGLGRIKRMT